MRQNQAKKRPAGAKRGISIVECVIALSVIVMIAMAAVSTASSALNITTNAFFDGEARSRCEDVIECYKRVNTASQVAALLSKAGYGYAPVGEGEDDEKKVYEWAGTRETYSFQIDDDGKLTVRAVKNGETIEELSYTKG